MDKSGAVNILLYGEVKSESSNGARWDIWPVSSIPTLSQALDPTASPEDCSTGQPIISEQWHASDKIILETFQATGRPHWCFIQLPGEAVIIPPGCPHQVNFTLNLVATS